MRADTAQDHPVRARAGCMRPTPLCCHAGRIRPTPLRMVALIAAMALMGCRSPAAAPQTEPGPPAGGPYLPLRVGNRWTYTSRRGDLVIRVVDARQVGAVTEVTVEEAGGTGGRTRRTYRQDGMGLFLVRSEEGGEVQDYSGEPQPVLLTPPRPGQRWVWRGPNGHRRAQYTAEVGQPEPVSTPAGTFPQAIPVQVSVVDQATPDKVLIHRQWLAPGVGPVRLEYQLDSGEVIRYELVAYQVR